MEISADFLEWLGPDASTNVFRFLEDPADIVRLTAVSRSWRRYVISDGLCKKLCLRKSSGLLCFTHVTVKANANMTGDGERSTCDTEWETLEKEHKVYSHLSRCILKPYADDISLISEEVSASSTVKKTMELRSFDIQTLTNRDGKSCWSIKVERNAEVLETLIYRLGSRFCIVNEIEVQPFEAYSAKAVRFRMGHSLLDPDEDLLYSSKKYQENPLHGSNKEFVWTYISPEFPMAQRNELQKFKLPCPALCVGGFMVLETTRSRMI